MRIICIPDDYTQLTYKLPVRLPEDSLPCYKVRVFDSTPKCLLRTLEAAERLPVDNDPEIWELLEVLNESAVGETPDGAIRLECGRCTRLFDLQTVGGSALYLCQNNKPCVVRDRLPDSI